MRRRFSSCIRRITAAALLILFLVPAAAGCSQKSNTADALADAGPGTRDNTPVCLVPTAPGKNTVTGSGAVIDLSNAEDGYVAVRYDGNCSKVKLQITCPDDLVYTYNLTPGDSSRQFFPLSSGDGRYRIGVYTNVKDNMYATACETELDVRLSDPYAPFLYPNQYSWFDKDSECVAKASSICLPANEDIDAVTLVYNWVVNNISYDKEKAANVQSNYLPDADETMKNGKGICFDYASLMCAMLRSQRIPTRLEIGYAGTAYHAWISVYLAETGWVDGIIRFDGIDWSIMDPTFAANTSSSKLEKFIGDGENYQTKYIY